MERSPTHDQLLASANLWEARANEHIKAADFCHEQAGRFLAHLAVPDDYRPTLVLLEGEKSTPPKCYNPAG